MKKGLSARAFVAGVVASICMGLATAADDAESLSDSSAPNDFSARDRHHQLDLPATTAREFLEHANLDEYSIYPDILGMSRHMRRKVFCF